MAARLSGGDRLPPAAVEILSPPASRAAGLNGEAWVMAVRWAGHESAVADAVQAAEARLAATWLEDGTRLWAGLAELEGRVDAALVVRADFPFRSTIDAVRHAISLTGAIPNLVASPLVGRLWIFVPGDARGGGDRGAALGGAG